MRIKAKEFSEPKMDMTSMSDIVFQLLAFFIMTFKILSPEGDFNIKMPLAAPSAGVPDDSLLPPIKIQLKANTDGSLGQIKMGENQVGDMTELRQKVFSLVGVDAGGPSEAASFEVEFDCDYDLQYQYIIQAVTAVTGYRDRDNNIVRLIEKVKFAPPRKPGA